MCPKTSITAVFRKSFTADRFWSLDPGSATCVPLKLFTGVSVPSYTDVVPLCYTFPSPSLCFLGESSM